MAGRDERGRFASGHPVAVLGWRGLVEKRFGGDEAVARAWLAQVGRHTYARQTVGGTRFKYRLQTIWPHPGSPEEFLANHNAALEFTLDDVEELAF